MESFNILNGVGAAWWSNQSSVLALSPNPSKNQHFSEGGCFLINRLSFVYLFTLVIDTGRQHAPCTFPHPLALPSDSFCIFSTASLLPHSLSVNEPCCSTLLFEEEPPWIPS